MSLVDPDETAEARHERVTEILRVNSHSLVMCIACQHPITHDQQVLETIHGTYHDLPMTCAEDGDAGYDERF